jgi:hypothetical protein
VILMTVVVVATIVEGVGGGGGWLAANGVGLGMTMVVAAVASGEHASNAGNGD